MVVSLHPYIPVTKNWTATEKIISISTTSFINIAAIIFNISILTTIIFTKRLRRETDSILIGNLAVSDLLVACCVMPFTTDVLLGDKLNYGPLLWTFIGFSNFFFCIASILNLVALSFDQFLKIKCPFKYTPYRKQAFALVMALLVWIYSGICALPPLFGISSYTCFIPNTGKCTFDQWSGTDNAVIFTVLVTVLTWGIGIIVLIYSNVQIYCVIIKQRVAIKKTMVHRSDCPMLIPTNQSSNGSRCPERSRDNERPSLQGKTKSSNRLAVFTLRSYIVGPERSAEASGNDQETRTNFSRRCNCIPSTKQATSLLIIVIVYFITWSPFCILLLVEIAMKKKKYQDLSLVFLWIGHLSSFLNPVLYFYRFRKFRDAAKVLLREVFTLLRLSCIFTAFGCINCTVCKRSDKES